MSKNSQAGRRSLAVVAAATVLALAAGGGAVAGSLITSKDIQDKTITSADLHKNSVKTQKVKDGTLEDPGPQQEGPGRAQEGRPRRSGRVLQVPRVPRVRPGPPTSPGGQPQRCLEGPRHRHQRVVHDRRRFHGSALRRRRRAWHLGRGTGFNHPAATGDTISFECTTCSRCTCGDGDATDVRGDCWRRGRLVRRNPASAGHNPEVVFTVPAGGTIRRRPCYDTATLASVVHHGMCWSTDAGHHPTDRRPNLGTANLDRASADLRITVLVGSSGPSDRIMPWRAAEHGQRSADRLATWSPAGRGPRPYRRGPPP